MLMLSGHATHSISTSSHHGNSAVNPLTKQDFGDILLKYRNDTANKDFAWEVSVT